MPIEIHNRLNLFGRDNQRSGYLKNDFMFEYKPTYRKKTVCIWIITLILDFMKTWPILLVFISVFVLNGCFQFGSQGSNSDKDNDTASQQTIHFTLSTPAFLQQIIAKPDSGKQANTQSSKVFSVNPSGRQAGILQYFSGSISIIEGTVTITSIPVTATIDDETLEVNLLQTLALSVGSYTFELLLTRGDFQYIGSTTHTVTEGASNDITITIYPIIGDTIIETGIIDELGSFKFSYPDISELPGIEPRLGVVVDGGDELIFDVSRDTGAMEGYLNLTVSEHTIELSLYDGQQQIAKSKPDLETQIITAGQNIAIDLIPIYGTTSYSMAVGGGDASFDVQIPSEVVDQAGSISNLSIPFLINGPGTNHNPLEGEITEFTYDVSEDEYHGKISFSGTFSLNNIHVYLEFLNLSEDELIGTCNFISGLNVTERTALCGIPVTNSLISSGKMLGTVGITVCEDDTSGDCSDLIGGANIYTINSETGDELIGITGLGGVIDQGFLETNLEAGDYTLRAVTSTGRFGEISFTVDPLQVENYEIELNASAPVSPSIVINNGNRYTYSQYVTLTLSAHDDIGITAYYVSENNEAPGLNDWQTVGLNQDLLVNTSFQMSSGVGEKTIYAWFKNFSGHRSERVQNSIVIQNDTTLYYSNFAITASRYSSPEDGLGESYCISEFGAGYRQLDWQEIVTIIAQNPLMDVDSFKNDMNITNSTAQGAFVTFNGNDNFQGEYFAVKEPRALLFGIIDIDESAGWYSFSESPIPNSSVSENQRLQLFYVDSTETARVLCYRDTGVHPFLNGDFSNDLAYWEHVGGSAEVISETLVLKTYDASGDYSRVEQPKIGVSPDTGYRITANVKTSTESLLLAFGVEGGTLTNVSYDIEPTILNEYGSYIEIAGESDNTGNNYYFTVTLEITTGSSTNELTIFNHFNNNGVPGQSATIDDITLQEL